jgi:hypothetical protein
MKVILFGALDRAMLAVAMHGAPKSVLESVDITALR